MSPLPFILHAQALVEQFRLIGERGTRILIQNLNGHKKDTYEFTFDNSDFVLKEEAYVTYSIQFIFREAANKEEYVSPDEFSLREYLSILYLEPRMKLVLCGKKVLPKRMLYSLYNRRETYYTPQKSTLRCI